MQGAECGFETDDFVVSTSIGAGTGAISSVMPMTSVGVAAKGLTSIVGSEIQYGLTTDEWATQGATNAAWYGFAGAAFDVGLSYPAQAIPGTSLSSIYPSGQTSHSLLQIAAKQRYGIGAGQALNGLASGVGSGLVTHFITKEKVMMKFSTVQNDEKGSGIGYP